MRNPSSTLVLVPLCVLALAGCATDIVLTQEGRTVQHVTSADLPGGCNLLGDVPIGLPPDAARPPTEQAFVYLMRNRTGERGGTHVTISSKEQRGTAEEPYFVGRGVAYACRESAAPVEEGSGEGQSEEGEGEGEGSEGGADIDDAI